MIGRHRFHPTFLRAYDARGIVGESLTAADAEALGRAFATVLARDGERRVCVGYDGRLSSPELEAALVAGLAESGAEVVRIGRGPTPMLYFAVHALAAHAGAMVTGSHNPPEYNGVKMVRRQRPFYGERIAELGRIAATGAYTEGAGSVAECDIGERYIAALLDAYDGERSLDVAWDAGNGATGEILARLLARLPGRHRLLNGAIDGRFPAHHPDPTVPENLAQLIAAVRADGLDAGFAFDGDGDRIGLVDGKGRILWGDQILLILARDVLRHCPGATVIADVKASQVLFDEIARLGGRALMWRTGHSLIKAKMAEERAPLAGEMSGHIFFGDRYYGFDDALYAAVRMLGVLSRAERTLAEIHDSLPTRVSTPEIRFPCPEERKFAVIDEVRRRLGRAGARFVDIDGVRVMTDDGWWLLRASNTQPALVARCEGVDEGALDRLKASLQEALEASGVHLPA